MYIGIYDIQVSHGRFATLIRKFMITLVWNMVDTLYSIPEDELVLTAYETNFDISASHGVIVIILLFPPMLRRPSLSSLCFCLPQGEQDSANRLKRVYDLQCFFSFFICLACLALTFTLHFGISFVYCSILGIDKRVISKPGTLSRDITTVSWLA